MRFLEDILCRAAYDIFVYRYKCVKVFVKFVVELYNLQAMVTRTVTLSYYVEHTDSRSVRLPAQVMMYPFSRTDLSIGDFHFLRMTLPCSISVQPFYQHNTGSSPRSIGP
jgi:hypothetical protein